MLRPDGETGVGAIQKWLPPNRGNPPVVAPIGGPGDGEGEMEKTDNLYV